MKRLLLPTAVILSLGSLAACGDRTVYITQEPTTTTAPRKTATTVADEPIAVSPSDRRSNYLYDIYDLYDGPIYADDKLLIDLGVEMCAQLQTGMSSDALNEFLVANTPWNVDMDLIAAINVSAVVNICPDQKYKYGQ